MSSDCLAPDKDDDSKAVCPQVLGYAERRVIWVYYVPTASTRNGLPGARVVGSSGTYLQLRVEVTRSASRNVTRQPVLQRILLVKLPKTIWRIL